MTRRTAAVLTVGSELTSGFRLDTNSAEIARALSGRAFAVTELVSVGDDVDEVAAAIRRLVHDHSLVVTTGGLGPTHDDVTREAASQALGIPLVRDARLVGLLQPAVARHGDPEAAAQVLVQADVLAGAEVIDMVTGTAPGLVITTPTGLVALLPGPPVEMRPMLASLLERFEATNAEPRELGVTGRTESDAQVAAARALAHHTGVRLTVLARPGDVRVVLFDEGAGPEGLARAAADVADALGDSCYATDGASLAETLVRRTTERALTLAFAESCTGGLVCAAVSDVPGASACFRGGLIAYDDDVKRTILNVSDSTLAEHGAVSSACAAEMATGVRESMCSDVAVSVTGIAGPAGGSPGKPVGLVWFGVATASGVTTHERRFPPTSREAVRDRAAAAALDLARRAVLAP